MNLRGFPKETQVLHNLIMVALYLSIPISGMLFYLIGFRPSWGRSAYPGAPRGVVVKSCPTCRRPL